MKRCVFNHLLLLSVAAALVLFVSCKEKNEQANNKYNETTQMLVSLVDNNSNLKSLLEEAIDKAKDINPDPETNPAQSLEKFYDFVDFSQTAMPWDVMTNCAGQQTLGGKMNQALCYCYFINTMELESLQGQNLFTASVQYVEPYRSWLVNYCKSWGNFLSSPQSWSQEYVDLVMAQPELRMEDYEPSANWNSFNDFFCRHLSSPEKRPIASPDDASVVVSPCDGVPQGVWHIDNDSYLENNGKVTIKSREFNSIRTLIGPDSEYADAFAGGTFYHVFLDVFDYHRYHFPVGGILKELKVIPADDALGGYIHWDADKQQYIVDCEEPGWQSIETRGLAIVETDEYGLVAVMPIGMSQVASVNFEPNLKVGDRVEKGDMLGYFLFGGSDFVLVFQEGANFQLDIEENNNGGWDHMLMGERLGSITKTN